MFNKSLRRAGGQRQTVYRKCRDLGEHRPSSDLVRSVYAGDLAAVAGFNCVGLVAVTLTIMPHCDTTVGLLQPPAELLTPCCHAQSAAPRRSAAVLQRMADRAASPGGIRARPLRALRHPVIHDHSERQYRRTPTRAKRGSAAVTISKNTSTTWKHCGLFKI